VIVEDPLGNLLVSIISQGKVVALPDKNHDGIADEVITVAEGLHSPHGLAFRCGKTCKLYIAETDQVAVYDYDQINLKASNKKKIIDLPDDGGHFTRTIMLMPSPNQDKLLTSVGSSVNAAYEKDWRRAKILISNTDGTNLKIFASGLRNSVFMAIHPLTGQIWATEMGRDYLGDNLPPDEINIIEQDKDYGWPDCYGKNVHDTDFDKNTNPCKEPYKTASYIDIPAHSAPLGLAFFPEEGWPEEYWYNLLVAYHGSWNRSIPTGYKIVRYKLDKEGNYLGKEDFITGWLTEEKRAFGRPVDILIRPGVIFISDDKAGLIYKVHSTLKLTDNYNDR
jgi:glucose/arabinose dehydrogenase